MACPVFFNPTDFNFYLMKNIRFYFLLTAAVVLTVQCTPEEKPGPEPEVPETTIVLQETEINAPAEGGTFSVAFSVENLSDSLLIETVSGGDWLDADPSGIGEIVLNIIENDGTSARTDTVFVFCNSALSGNIVVNQEGKTEDTPVEYGFFISVGNVDQTSVAYEISPDSPDMYYLSKVALKSVVDAFASDDELIQADFDELQMYAGMTGTPVWTLMTSQGFTKTGDYSGFQDNLAPGTDYYIYAYGVEPEDGGIDVNAVTKVYKESFTTVPVPQEEAEFTITYRVESNVADATVEPKDQNQRYYFAYEHKDSWTTDDEILAKYQQNLSSMYDMYLMFGMSVEDFFEQMTNIGTQTIEIVGLLPENTYVGFAVAINDEAIFCSEMTKAEFTTLPVGDSDNRISISITDVGEDWADFEITTTNDDPYVFFIEPSSTFEGLDDDEIIQFALDNISYTTTIYNGDYSDTASPLTPGTEYTALAFGYITGTATTGLVKTGFHTLAAE